nr:DUF397 domain-containing protein [Streptomyces monomycini]
MTAELAYRKSSYSNPDAETCVEVAYSWRKSSYSSEQDADTNCVEVAYAWCKSSYSSEQSADTNCVEVAPTPTTIHIRDSKNITGPALSVPPTAWADFLRLIS